MHANASGLAQHSRKRRPENLKGNLSATPTVTSANDGSGWHRVFLARPSGYIDTTADQDRMSALPTTPFLGD
jgi:hypothetical protein